MIKAAFVAITLIAAALCSQMAVADVIGGRGQLVIFSPVDVYVNKSATMLIQLLDYNAQFMSGKNEDIAITIRKNHTYLVQGEHPFEIELSGQSFYQYDFIADKMGQYLVIATYQDIIAFSIFVSKFELPKNITEMQNRTDVAIVTEHEDRINLLRQTLYQLSSLDKTIGNITRKQESMPIAKTLQRAAIDNALQVVFYTIVFMIILIISSILYTRSKDRYKIYRAIEEIPVQVAREITQEVERSARRK